MPIRTMRTNLWLLLAVLISGSLYMVTGSSSGSSGSAGWHPAKLGEGKNSGYFWMVTLSRSRGSDGGSFPCVNVSLQDLQDGGSVEEDFGGSTTLCSSLGPNQGPNIVASSDGHGDEKFTVVGLAVSTNITSLRIDLGAAGSRRLDLRLLNSRQRRNSGVQASNYATFVIDGPSCIGEVIGYNAAGRVIYQRPSEGCSRK
jgi:hypothetical protein